MKTTQASPLAELCTSMGLTVQSSEPTGVILHRRMTLVNTDPQRRCYDGCHFSSELQWTAWEPLEYMKFMKPGTDPETRLKFWRELNDYAVSQRGEEAKSEFKFETETE